MATPKTIRAGQAYVELATRNNKLNAGLRAASAKMKSWGAAATASGLKLAAVGTAVAGPLLAANKHFLEAGDRLAKMSQRTGLSVEALSELEHAATQSGTSLEVVEQAARELQKKGLDPRDFDKYAAAIAAIEDPTERAQKAMELFGRRSGTQLLPMVSDLQALRQEARDLGLVMSGKDAQAAVVLGDALSNLWKTVKMGVFTIGAALEPALTSVVGPIQELLTKGLKWIDANRELFAWAFKIALAVTAAGAAIVAFGVGLTVVGTALGGIASLFGLIGSALSAVLGLVGFLISPLGLVIALVAGLAGYFLYSSGVAGEVIDFLGSLFGDLAGIAKTSFGAIGKALAAGDIALAAKVLWTALKLAWQTGINALWGPWTAFRNTLLDQWTDLKTALADIATLIWSGIQKAFSHGVEAALKIVYSLLRGYYTIQQMLGKDVSVEMMSLFGAELATSVMGKKERQEIDKATAGARDQLTQMGEEEKARRERDTQRELTGAAEELAKAAAEWQDAVGQADALPTLAQRAGPRGTAASALDLPDIESIHQRTSRATASGAFSAQAASFLGSSSAADRTANATEQTARNTKKLLDQPAPAFG